MQLILYMEKMSQYGVFVSRRHIEQQDDTLMQLNEELVAAKESLQSSCLQNKMLQRDKEQLGLLLLFVIWVDHVCKVR